MNENEIYLKLSDKIDKLIDKLDNKFDALDQKLHNHEVRIVVLEQKAPEEAKNICMSSSSSFGKGTTLA